MYRVFIRNWWKENASWPDGLEPDTTARKYPYRDNIETEDEAVAICAEYNRKHSPGRLSRKAEFERT